MVATMLPLHGETGTEAACDTPAPQRMATVLPMCRSHMQLHMAAPSVASSLVCEHTCTAQQCSPCLQPRCNGRQLLGQHVPGGHVVHLGAGKGSGMSPEPLVICC